ncbi:MAG: hypothetical protein ABI723_24960 [Bacteroidia bacterium]
MVKCYRNAYTCVGNTTQQRLKFLFYNDTMQKKKRMRFDERTWREKGILLMHENSYYREPRERTPRQPGSEDENIKNIDNNFLGLLKFFDKAFDFNY